MPKFLDLQSLITRLEQAEARCAALDAECERLAAANRRIVADSARARRLLRTVEDALAEHGDGLGAV